MIIIGDDDTMEMKVGDRFAYNNKTIEVTESKGNCAGCFIKPYVCEQYLGKIFPQCSKYKRLDGVGVKFIEIK
ncbi:MAG: hypothetical protein ACRCZ0_01210 [Cetobacterium sp.]